MSAPWKLHHAERFLSPYHVRRARTTLGFCQSCQLYPGGSGVMRWNRLSCAAGEQRHNTSQIPLKRRHAQGEEITVKGSLSHCLGKRLVWSKTKI